MRAEPKDISPPELFSELEHGWGIRIAECQYVPVGGGSHHWRAADTDGRQHWVTVDELTNRPYLGTDRETVWVALSGALRAACYLRQRLGLEFVVAPRPAAGGEAIRALGSRYALALYPHLKATALDFGQPLDTAMATELARLLARLHAADGSLISSIRPEDAHLPGRPGLELALRELDKPWSGGPFSEPAREAVARELAEIRELLRAFDDLYASATAAGKFVVVTHGEPHPANLLRSDDGLFLVDWDTLAADAAERDLWWLHRHPDALAEYERATGRIVDERRMRLYQLRWKLDDIASFVHLFRSPHEQNEDTERWWTFAGRLTAASTD